MALGQPEKIKRLTDDKTESDETKQITATTNDEYNNKDDTEQQQQQHHHDEHEHYYDNGKLNNKMPEHCNGEIAPGIVDKYNCSESKNKLQQQQSLFELVYDIIGEKEHRTKEMGTLILLAVIFLLFIISLTGFFVMWFTEYYNNTMLENLILANNSETAKSWINPNPKYDTLLKVHVFNYTNIQDYLEYKADKIKIVDIGPLTYKEHTRKVNVVFNDNHTVTFRDHRSYEFLRDKSTHDENIPITVPNVPYLAASLEIDKIQNFFTKGLTFRAVQGTGEKPFKKLLAKDFLWGYTDKVLSLKNLFSSGANSKFGLLMSRNGTSVDSLQINTGVDDIRKFSIITQFNGKPSLGFWSDDECNRVDGSDPSMFSPHLVENRETLHVFLQVLCRKIPLHFEKEVTIFNNIDALRYRTALNAFSNPQENPNNTCYCKNTKTCFPSGVINATKCYDGAPIYPSFPHFFAGDPAIYKEFEGIKPIQELHQTYADVHPRFAFPISGASRVQINLAVHKGPLVNDKLKRIEDGMILPLIWIEITSGDFTDEIIDTLYTSTFGLNLIQYTLKYGTLIMSLVTFGIIVAGFYYLARKREEYIMQNEKCANAELRALHSIHASSISLSQMQS